MTCSEILPLLDVMLDDQAQTETTVAVFRHLEECLSCHATWTESLAARERLHSFRDRIEMPLSLPAKIRDLISSNSPEVVVMSVAKRAEEEAPAIESQDLLRDDIIEVLAGLSPRERDVLHLRFGLDDGRPRTLDEVAQLFGVTRERLRRIEAKALRKLRRPIRSQRMRGFVD